MEPGLEPLLARITDMVERTDSLLMKLSEEVREIRDSRFRPFFAVGGAFLAIVIGVMSYIYSLEIRLRDDLYALGELVHDVEQKGEVNEERLAVTNERLLARSDNQSRIWESHTNRHNQMDEGLRILVGKLLDGTLVPVVVPEEEER